MDVALEVTYDTAAALAEDFRTQLRLGGLYAQVDGAEGLPAFAALTLRLRVASGDVVEVPARLTAAGSGSICVEVLAEERPALEARVQAITRGVAACAGGRVARIIEAPGGSAGAPAGDTPPPAHGGPRPIRPTAGLTLERKLLAMSVGEKIQLALHGDRDARTLLLRGERAGGVQSALIRNPKAGLDEMSALARSPLLATDAAEALAQHPSWGTSPQIALALARNPRTPVPVAVGCLDRLQPSDLRTLAKGLGVRTVIAQAARKRLIK